MEIECARRQSGRLASIIDVVIERFDQHLAFIGHGDARVPLKGHGEETVQIFYASDGKHFRLPGVVVTETKSEEIADGSLYARGFFAVPVNTEHNPLQMVRLRAGDGEPQMGNQAGAIRVEHG